MTPVLCRRFGTIVADTVLSLPDEYGGFDGSQTVAYDDDWSTTPRHKLSKSDPFLWSDLETRFEKSLKI